MGIGVLFFGPVTYSTLHSLVRNYFGGQPDITIQSDHIDYVDDNKSGQIHFDQVSKFAVFYKKNCPYIFAIINENEKQPLPIDGTIYEDSEVEQMCRELNRRLSIYRQVPPPHIGIPAN